MKIIFLDRDGVINRFPGLGDYVTKVKNFHFIPGSLTALRLLTKKGYKIFIISNQAGVTRGVYSKAKLEQINSYMLRNVRKTGGKITKAYYCIHTPDQNCECRKPKIGSIREALIKLNKTIYLARKTFFVGDTEADIKAGDHAGCKTILVLSGKDTKKDAQTWPVKPDFIAKNLLEAAGIVTNENSRHPRLRRRRA